MDQDEQQLQKRWRELAERAERRGQTVWTEFLDLAAQDLLSRSRLAAPWQLIGGYSGAERQLAAFGPAGPPPLVCLRIAPRSAKFADELGHRDFLGALLSLGVRRELLGDILVAENCGWLFCLESIAPYLSEQLTQVKHTWVTVEQVEPPELVIAPPPVRQIVVASPRLDALLAAVYRLSRSDSQQLISQGRVYVNSRLRQDASFQLEEEDLVSVRGQGRFRFVGVERETKKGRLRAQVRVY